MKRGSFLKSLFTLIVSPKLISEINWENSKSKTQCELFNDMNLIVPDYLPELYARYGNENYSLLIETLGA